MGVSLLGSDVGSIIGQEGGSGGGAWGDITGTLSDQTDLQTTLDGKVDENAAITGATKTKITYDAKGLVTAGADATTADIADSSNKRYVTDAQLTVIGNTSGTNTGDNATNSQYSGLAASKQDTLVSGTNIKTINSTTLLGAGNIAVATSAQGALADTAVQPAGLSGYATTAAVAAGYQPLATVLTNTTASFTTAQETKLSGIEALAQVNAIDTVTDTAEIDLTITAKALSASIVVGSIDETKLDTSVNASLDLADSALQAAAIGVTVQGYSAVLAATTASFTTADETKLDGIEALADVTDTANVTSAGALMDSEVTSLAAIKNAVIPSGMTIEYGTYIPTLDNTTNVAASTAFTNNYVRVGSIVTVSGSVSIDPTTTGATILGMTIPVASNFSSIVHLGGTAVTKAIANTCIAIEADGTNDRASFAFVAVDTSNRTYQFSFTYRII